MAVDECIKARGVRNDFLAGPRRGRRIHTQMTQADHIVCAHLPGLVHRFLDGIVKLPSVIAAQNVVDVPGLAGIHEVGRGGFGKGLGGGHAHKGDPLFADPEHLVSRQDPQVGAQIDPVAGNIGEVGFLNDCLGTRHPVIELMVARGRQIVACGVHQLDDGCAIIHRAVGRALNVVTGIHQQNLLTGILVALLQRSDGRIGQFRRFVVDVGVDVVGVEDRERGVAVRRLLSKCHRQIEGGCRQRSGGTRSFQEAAAGNELLHRDDLL